MASAARGTRRYRTLLPWEVRFSTTWPDSVGSQRAERCMPEMRVNGVDLSYIDDGVGTPVALVHGAWIFGIGSHNARGLLRTGLGHNVAWVKA